MRGEFQYSCECDDQCVANGSHGRKASQVPFKVWQILVEWVFWRGCGRRFRDGKSRFVAIGVVELRGCFANLRLGKSQLCE